MIKDIVIAEDNPRPIIPPLPDNRAFNAALSELQYHFIIWSMRQPWAKDLRKGESHATITNFSQTQSTLEHKLEEPSVISPNA